MKLNNERTYFPGCFILFVIFAFLLIAILLLMGDRAKAETLDHVWTASKIAAYPTASADAWTTSQAISRGYVEANPLDNLLIDRARPAYAQRLLLLNAQEFGINAAFNFGYKKCGPSKLCKLTVIGGRGLFTGFHIYAVFHNRKMR